MNGHDVFVHCSGTGPRTVLFLHGSDATLEPTQYVHPVEELLTDDFRFCVYDRSNIGLSAPVAGVPTPDALADDVDTVLDEIGADRPAILLGASFGGLLADIYARTHPDRVAGIVELDSIFPGMLPLDRLVPTKYTAKANSASDKANSLERISTYDFLRYAEARATHQPRVPLQYLATEGSWKNTVLGKTYDHAAQIALAAYIDGFSPGTLQWVNAPHFMEPVIPHQIADAVREVAAASTTARP